MRILLINKFWRPAGGVEVHLLEVQRYLQSLGHEVIPWAMREPGNYPSVASDYFVEPVSFRSGSSRESLQALKRSTLSSDSKRSLREVIRVFKPEVAYVAHVYHQLGTAVLNELHSAGIPTILSLHDYKPACPNYRFYSEASDAICTRCLDSKFAALYAPVVERCWDGDLNRSIALSLEALATRLRGSYKKPQVVTVLNSLQRQAVLHIGVDPTRVMTLPHPVELGPTRKRMGGTRGPGNFLYIGRLVPEKGVDVLIKASALTALPVDIVGSGRHETQLKELARDLRAPVTFSGDIPHEAVPKLLRGSLALVVPSVWHEVSPLVVLEAIAADVPVIASRVGGIVDQLADGSGFMFDPGNVQQLAEHLAAVHADPELGRLASRNARTRAETLWTRHGWEMNLDKALEMALAPISPG